MQLNPIQLKIMLLRNASVTLHHHGCLKVTAFPLGFLLAVQSYFQVSIFPNYNSLTLPTSWSITDYLFVGVWTDAINAVVMVTYCSQWVYWTSPLLITCGLNRHCSQREICIFYILSHEICKLKCLNPVCQTPRSNAVMKYRGVLN